MVQEYIDPIMQEIEVKSANNKRLLVYGVVNDTMAAKFSYFTDKIIANDKIHKVEMNKLLSQMETCENPFTCPHGRPTIVEISKKEIEKMFKRIM